jgi:hypothetical protein
MAAFKYNFVSMAFISASCCFSFSSICRAHAFTSCIVLEGFYGTLMIYNASEKTMAAKNWERYDHAVPFFILVMSLCASSTMPINSWPMIACLGCRTPPLRICRSEPQIAVGVTFKITTRPVPGADLLRYDNGDRRVCGILLLS